MTTTVAKPDAIRTPATSPTPRLRRTRVRAFAFSGLIVTLAAISVGTWLIVDGVVGGSTNPLSAATPAPPWTPIASPWLEAVDVSDLKRQLVHAGYSIKVDSNLDPVTKSALADYLQLDPAHPLSPFLANALAGTVITGFRNPAAWNSRFGLHRLTKFVERPLTGPGGQLDSNGNLRATTVVAPARRAAQAVALRDGKIAFVQDGFLKVVNPDGSGTRVLTGASSGPLKQCSGSCEIGAPAWSPSGKQIAFLRGDAGSGPACVQNCRRPNLSLFVIGADGSGERRLAHCGGACGSYPIGSFAWSPDGRNIAFTRHGLSLFDTQTGNVRRLAATGENPAWSPDGSRIAYTFGGELSVVSVAGEHHPTPLAPSDDTAPSWSPDGQTLVFGGTDDIYTIRADGSRYRKLLSGAFASGPSVPSWSRDGRRILYFYTPGSPGHFFPEVWTMSPTGAHRERLYRGPCCVAVWLRPIWSPDGRKVAFSQNADVIVMNANGSQKHTVARFASDLAWQPIR